MMDLVCHDLDMMYRPICHQFIERMILTLRNL
jgi:hypothetical protein